MTWWKGKSYKSESAVKVDVHQPVTMEVALEEPLVEPMPDVEAGAHQTSESADRRWLTELLWLQEGVAWVEDQPMQMQVTQAVMLAVLAIAPLEKAEMEVHKTPVEQQALHGLPPEIMAIVVASDWVAMAPLILATTSDPEEGAEAVITAEAEAAVTAGISLLSEEGAVAVAQV